MILNNKTTNPLGYSLDPLTEAEKAKLKDNVEKHIFDPNAIRPARQVCVFPGVTGNHPKELLDSPAFIHDTESDPAVIEVITENAPYDPVRAKMNVAEQVKLADFDVAEFCTAVDEKKTEKERAIAEKKQIKVIENIFKIPTLQEIEKHEKRSNVLQAIARQYKSIETSIRKDDRQR
jgi:ATP-dependent RNA circularization protein (DNA/RNA ligase family)